MHLKAHNASECRTDQLGHFKKTDTPKIIKDIFRIKLKIIKIVFFVPFLVRLWAKSVATFFNFWSFFPSYNDYAGKRSEREWHEILHTSY
jgi:hypothetical protein